jgi:hypothetical protein
MSTIPLNEEEKAMNEEEKDTILENKFQYMRWYAALSVGRDPAAWHPLPDKYGVSFARVCDACVTNGNDTADEKGWEGSPPALRRAAAGFYALITRHGGQEEMIAEDFHGYDAEGLRHTNERFDAGLHRLYEMVSTPIQKVKVLCKENTNY